MALARAVTFSGVSKERIDEISRRITEGDRPEGLDPTEMILLHNPEAEQSLAIIFFDDEDAYRRGDEILSAMPTGDVPGQRTSITKYDVAARMTT